MEINRKNIPEHVAIIMDGNGRWARRRGLPRVFGHREGVKAVTRVVKSAIKLRVKYLTLYAFSQENWKRPQKEVDALMDLLVIGLEKNLRKLHKQGVQLKVIGDISTLPVKVKKKLDETIVVTQNNEKITLTLALNYGSRWDIVNSIHQILKSQTEDTSKENLLEQISVEAISQNLSTAIIPEPDLLIRTSGEKRLSNFLLWESAYSELFFTDELWPDFGNDSLLNAIQNYQLRDRRFGGIKS